jgi:hypothetical protein
MEASHDEHRSKLAEIATLMMIGVATPAFAGSFSDVAMPTSAASGQNPSEAALASGL